MPHRRTCSERGDRRQEEGRCAGHGHSARVAEGLLATNVRTKGQVVARAAGSKLREKIAEQVDAVHNGQVWRSMFRPGSIFRRGYADSPRNRAYVVMNSLLYHLHPVKVKRHGIKLSYTLCLGGLTFFLFILLTITGIYLMFFYRPSVDFV